MKKDLDWLRKDFDRIIDQSVRISPDKEWDRGWNLGWNEARNAVHALTNQLDEPEVLSQEFINEKAVEVYADTADAEVHAVFRMRDLQTLLVPKKMNILEIETMLDDIGWWDRPTEEQVIVMAIEKGEIGHDGETYKVIKQEKPVVPEFVAEYIKDRKEQGYSLLVSLNVHNLAGHRYTKVRQWLGTDDELAGDFRNQEAFAQAWIAYPDIDAEEEPLYYAKLKTTYKLPSRYSGMYYDADNVFWVKKEATSSRTKEDWARLDVNDTNADFEAADAGG